MIGDLDKNGSFRAGFWDGLEKRGHETNEFGYIESDHGSVPPHHHQAYNEGWHIGTNLRVYSDYTESRLHSEKI